jgi:hypothetical protein
LSSRKTEDSAGEAMARQFLSTGSYFPLSWRWFDLFPRGSITYVLLSEDDNTWFEQVRAEWNQRLNPFGTTLGTHIFGDVPEVPTGATEEARLYASRYDAVRSLPKNLSIAEIGTQTGGFARFLLDEMQPARLHLFDLEFETLRRHRSELEADPRIKLHEGDSSTLLDSLEDKSLDIVYIDGEHSEVGVRRDTAVALKKLRTSGVLIYNDYTIWSPLELFNYGVVPVVNELLAGGRWRIRYIALHPLMYCDIALQVV